MPDTTLKCKNCLVKNRVPEARLQDDPRCGVCKHPLIKYYQEATPVHDVLLGSTGPRGGYRPGLVSTFLTSLFRGAGNATGRRTAHGVMNSIFGKR